MHLIEDIPYQLLQIRVHLVKGIKSLLRGDRTVSFLIISFDSSDLDLLLALPDSSFLGVAFLTFGFLSLLAKVGLLKEISMLDLTFKSSVHPGNNLGGESVSLGVIFAKTSLFNLILDLRKSEQLSLFHDFFALFGQSLSERTELGGLGGSGNDTGFLVGDVVLHPVDIE